VVVWLGRLLAPDPASAQARLSLELRGGWTLPAGSFTTGPREGGDIEGAPAFGLHFTLRRNRWLDLHAGFSQLRFGCEADGCVGEGELVSTAWDLGTHIRLRPGPWGPWIRVGLVLGGIELDLPEPAGPPEPPEGGARTHGPLHVASDTGVGGELGLGWRIRLADGWGLNPGLRYSFLKSRADDGTAFRMRYWVADVGLVLGF
jgi:hypothetical protein